MYTWKLAKIGETDLRKEEDPAEDRYKGGLGRYGVSLRLRKGKSDLYEK